MTKCVLTINVSQLSACWCPTVFSFLFFPRYSSECAAVGLSVIHTSQEPFIRSTSHLVGVVLSTRKSAVLNVVQFGHTTYPILIWNKQPTWLYATAGSSFIALTPRLGKY